jgi:hypothetical protein
MAIDILSIPPMSDEAERVFSGVRRSISWDRARLGSSITELLELISSWIKNGLIGKVAAPLTETEVQEVFQQLEGALEASTDEHDDLYSKK